MKKYLSLLFTLLVSGITLVGQYTTLNAHSHNDYANEVPFWLAYYNHFGSVETDIWAVEGELYVAHGRNEIRKENTFDRLYLQPVLGLFRNNKGRAWNDKDFTFQLLIDLKTPVDPTLMMLVGKLKEHPEVFDPDVNAKAVRIIISGNRPPKEEFAKYPEWITFDGLTNGSYDEKQLERIGLFSENLAKFTRWRGEGEIPQADRVRLKHVIDSVHSLNRKIRFWNAPDNPVAWQTFITLGADYINTDKINELSEFLLKR